MTDKIDEPRKGAPKPPVENAAAKKPSALLDLKAKEIRTEDKGAATVPSASSSAGPATAAANAQNPGPSGKSATPTPETSPASAKVSAGSSELPGKRPTGVTTAGEPVQKASGPQASSQPKASSAPLPKPAGAEAGGRRGAGGLLTHTAAGLLGGAVALMLAAIGPRLGIPGLQTGPSPVVVDDLARRVAFAERMLGERGQGPAAADLEQRLTAIESRVGRLDEIGRKVDQLADAQNTLGADMRALGEKVQQPSASKEVTDRITRLEQALGALTAAASADPQPGRIPQLAAITGRLNDLQATLGNQLAALRKSVTEEIDGRIVPSAEASEAAKSGTQRLDRELAAVKTDAARAAQRMEAFKATDDSIQQALRAVQEEAGGLRSALDGLKNDIASQLKAFAKPQDLTAAVAPVASRVAAIEQNLEGVLKSEDERKANAERVVLALEIGNLKRAIDRGGRYGAELDSVKRISGGQIDLSQLERYRDQGIPTQAELTRDFRTVANAAIDAETTPAESTTLDRLLRGAQSFVRVRRTDHRPDDASAEAVVGRMEKALTDDRLNDVLSEATRLQPKARSAAEDWLSRVDARATADRALARIEDQLKASMSGKPSAEKRT